MSWSPYSHRKSASIKPQTLEDTNIRDHTCIQVHACIHRVTCTYTQTTWKTRIRIIAHACLPHQIVYIYIHTHKHKHTHMNQMSSLTLQMVTNVQTQLIFKLDAILAWPRTHLQVGFSSMKMVLGR